MIPQELGIPCSSHPDDLLPCSALPLCRALQVIMSNINGNQVDTLS